MTSSSFTFPVVSFRHLETPFEAAGYRDYFAILDARELPDFSGWRKINVRDPKLRGSVPEAIRKGFREKPDMFVFMNRGLVLSVDKVKYDNKASCVTIEMTDPTRHGLLDGGHTYNIILDERDNLDEPQYVRVEMLEGFDQDNVLQVVDARNTSNQVKDQSLMNLGGEFDRLKEALAGTPYVDMIAFKEYEFDQDGNPKPLDVRDIVAILTLFDRANFDESIHPINAYRSKAACLTHFKEHSADYRKIYPLATEILALYDRVQEHLPDLYNTVRGQTGNVSGGKFGKLTGVVTYTGRRSQHLYFINKESRYGVPEGFTYPVLGAFRALLEERNGRYVWGKGLNPISLLTGNLGLKLADTIGNFALDNQNPSKTGKSPLVWQACYQSAQVAYLTAK